MGELSVNSADARVDRPRDKDDVAVERRHPEGGAIRRRDEHVSHRMPVDPLYASVRRFLRVGVDNDTDNDPLVVG